MGKIGEIGIIAFCVIAIIEILIVAGVVLHERSLRKWEDKRESEV